MLSRFDDKPIGDSMRNKLQEFWRPYKYLIIDEMSMISKKFLAQIEKKISIGKATQIKNESGSFGGISVILCGDFHQFPPVATSTKQSLYHRSSPTDKHLMLVGCALYEEFTTVVILREQMRIKDPIWHEFPDMPKTWKSRHRSHTDVAFISTRSPIMPNA